LLVSQEPTYDELAVEVRRLAVENAELGERVVALEAENARLGSLVEELRRAGKRQAAPFAKPRKQNPRRPGRKAGERYGRHGRRRPPPGEPDEVLDAPVPGRCPFCGGLVEVESWGEQWTEDIPEARTTTTLVRIPLCRCRQCGRRSRGRHPAQSSDALGAAACGVGPRAVGLAATLHYEGGLSLARTAAALRRLGLAITPGGLSHAFARLGRRVEPTYEALKAELARSAVVSPDETGWRIGGERAWLWVFATAAITVYHVARGRGFAQATEVLPATFAGSLVRDGWAPYRSYAEAAHQSCLAHLTRRSSELCQSLPPADRWIPRDVEIVLKTGLEVRDLRAAGSIGGDYVARVLSELDRCVDKLCRLRPAHADNRRLLAHLGRERDALFTFLRDPTVDATNWRAERGVRGPVVNRKTWGGNRNDVGARTLEVIATVLRTAAQQGLDAVAIFGDLLRSPEALVAPIVGVSRPPPG
jgi:transposase